MAKVRALSIKRKIADLIEKWLSNHKQINH